MTKKELIYIKNIKEFDTLYPLVAEFLRQKEKELEKLLDKLDKCYNYDKWHIRVRELKKLKKEVENKYNITL